MLELIESLEVQEAFDVAGAWQLEVWRSVDLLPIHFGKITQKAERDAPTVSLSA